MALGTEVAYYFEDLYIGRKGATNAHKKFILNVIKREFIVKSWVILHNIG